LKNTLLRGIISTFCELGVYLVKIQKLAILIIGNHLRSWFNWIYWMHKTRY